MDKLIFEYRVISKAKRMFLLFKPREIVQGEEFDLELTFNNYGERFCGGSFRLDLKYPELGIYSSLGVVQLQPIEKGGSINLRKENLIASYGSNCSLELKEQKHYLPDGKEVWGGMSYLYSSLSNEVRDSTGFPLPIATREELYQKYSVIVALWASTISIIIATLSIVFSIFR